MANRVDDRSLFRLGISPAGSESMPIPACYVSGEVTAVRPLRYADKAHRGSASPMVVIETGDRSSIVDAGRGGLFALRRIEGGDCSIRIAYETVLGGILKTSWLVDKDLAFLERRVQAD
jgi:hypothetical protein